MRCPEAPVVANSAYLALERRVICERTKDARTGGHCAPFWGVQGTKRAQARLKRCDIREHVQLDFTCEIALQARRNRAPDGNGGLEGAPCQQIFEIGSWREAGWGSRAPLDANLSSRSPARPASQPRTHWASRPRETDRAKERRARTSGIWRTRTGPGHRCPPQSAKICDETKISAQK